MSPLVDDVEIEDHLHVPIALELGDGLANRRVFVEREDVRVHDAARRLLVVLEEVLDHARLLRTHQVENGGRELLRQVVDQGSRIVGGDFLGELGDLLGGPGGKQRGARLRAELRDQHGSGFRTQLAQRLHGEPVVALNEHGKRRYAIAVRELTKNLREVGGMLLLEEIQQVGDGTNAEQPLDRVEDEIDSTLRRHENPSAHKRLRVA